MPKRLDTADPGFEDAFKAFLAEHRARQCIATEPGVFRRHHHDLDPRAQGQERQRIVGCAR